MDGRKDGVIEIKRKWEKKRTQTLVFVTYSSCFFNNVYVPTALTELQVIIIYCCLSEYVSISAPFSLGILETSSMAISVWYYCSPKIVIGYSLQSFAGPSELCRHRQYKTVRAVAVGTILQMLLWCNTRAFLFGSP